MTMRSSTIITTNTTMMTTMTMTSIMADIGVGAVDKDEDGDEDRDKDGDEAVLKVKVEVEDKATTCQLAGSLQQGAGGNKKGSAEDSRLCHVNNFVPGTTISNPNDTEIITIDEEVSPMMPRELYAASAHASVNNTSTSSTASIPPQIDPSAACGQRSFTSTAIAISAATMIPHEEDAGASNQSGLSH